MTPRIYYFGCRGADEPGHFFWLPGMHSPWSVNREQPEKIIPWGFKVDSGLAPRPPGNKWGECDQGIAALHHKDGWTALSFWDRTGDERGNSSSTFIVEGTHDFDEVIALAREQFPNVFARFAAAGLEVVPLMPALPPNDSPEEG